VLTDTHCHLDWRAYDDDREAVIERAVAAGVRRMITIGIDLATSRTAVALAARYPAVYAAVGVHPNDCAGLDDAALAELRALAHAPKVVALGEIGLDYYWHKVAPDEQERAFRAQLALAAELGLPVIIHNRDATEDCLAVLAEWAGGLAPDAPRGVLHSFSADWPAAERALALGFYLGISGPITFKKADTLRAVVAARDQRAAARRDRRAVLDAASHRSGTTGQLTYASRRPGGRSRRAAQAVARQTSANAAQVFAGLEPGR
jgi:TatD DNase family protein